MFNKTTIIAALFACTGVSAAEIQITGNVASKCSIFTTKEGVYGSPMSHALSTAPADGGVQPILRVDVATGGNYIAKITTPSGFTTSPALNEQETWTGDVTVDQVSDPSMSAYDTTKTRYDNTHEYDLTTAGSTWFKVDSAMEYGENKPLPGGTYVAMVVAECIAK